MTMHRLANADLVALAAGPVTADLVGRLRAAEQSRRLVLLEAVRRRLRETVARGAGPPPAELAAFDGAFQALARRDRADAGLVRDMLTRPQIAAWTARSLHRLAEGDHADLGYLTSLMRNAASGGGAVPAADRLRVMAGTARLDVVLDHADPYLDLYGPRAARPGPAETAAWRERLTGALRLLVRDDPAMAGSLQEGLTTIVPLAGAADGRPVSASSGWAFGAVALSLPPDAASCADGLVHEFRHGLLGVAADLVPLLEQGGDEPVYSPWRETPRPLMGLLVGCHAYVGLLALWHRRADLAGRCARWLEPTAQAAEALWASGALTGAGRMLVAAIRERLEGWRRQRAESDAVRVASDAAADHRLRWRLRHLRPDEGVLAGLAGTWPGPARPVRIPVHVQLIPVRPLPPGPRSRLLELGCGGYGDPPAQLPGRADRALLDGRYAEAAEAYKQRITGGEDPDAWAGLALCRRRSHPADVLGRCPELAAALHTRLRARTGRAIDPDELAGWLEAGQAGDQLMGSRSRLIRPR